MSRRHQLIILAALSVITLLGCRHILLTLSHVWPVEYGEGVTLYWARQAQAGEPIYPEISSDTLPWRHNPYGPLSSLLLAPFSTLLGSTHPFLPGRLLSSLAWIGTVLLVYRASRHHLNRHWALGCALALGFSPIVLRYGTMMRVDMLAVFLGISSLLCSRKRDSVPTACAASLLAVAAFLTKQSMITPGLILCWNLIRVKKTTIRISYLIGGCLPLVLVLHPALRDLSSVGQHLISLQQLDWDNGHFFQTLAGWAGTYAPLIVLGVVSLVEHRDDLNFWILLSLIPLLLTLGIAGSEQNYFLELTVLLMLATVRSLPRWIERGPNAVMGLILLQLFLWLPLPSPPVFTRTYGQEIPAGSTGSVTPGKADREIGRLIDAELASLPGPIYASEPGWLLKHGHDLVIQPYQFGQLIQQDDWPDDALVRAITQQNFSALLIKGDVETGSAPYLPVSLQQQILSTYSLYRVIGPWHLYLSHQIEFNYATPEN